MSGRCLMERTRVVAGWVRQQRWSDGEGSALNLGALTRCVRLVVCWATGCLLRRELREVQAVNLPLCMVPPGPWGQFPATEQRTVPAPAAAWQMVQGATRLGRPPAHPDHGGTALARGPRDTGLRDAVGTRPQPPGQRGTDAARRRLQMCIAFRFNQIFIVRP